MPCPVSRRRFLKLGICGSLAASTGCGTILYPERIGQPRGPLDWKVVALDTLGLLLFFIPGVIAFAVDFHNRTIYLPQYYGAVPQAGTNKQLVSVQMPEGDLTLEGVEKVVSQHAERSVRLLPGQYQTWELETVDQFWATYDDLTA